MSKFWGLISVIKGRQILDGALIATEVIDSCKRNNTKATLLKLDFHKAFDGISWAYLDWVLEKMNFPLNGACGLGRVSRHRRHLFLSTAHPQTPSNSNGAFGKVTPYHRSCSTLRWSHSTCYSKRPRPLIFGREST